jgi:hypothetical protein
MRSLRRRLAPALAAGALTILLAAPALAVEWSDPVRLTPARDSALSALHELASGGGRLHLAHARLGPKPQDDAIVYQRSSTQGASWSKERPLFRSTSSERIVIPNLAVAATGETVVVAWRTRGPAGSSLWVRRSTNGGTDWEPRIRLFATDTQRGIGTPALSIAGDTLIAAWTDRTTGRVLLRRSGNGGESFGAAKLVGRTHLSIDCQEEVLDGLVGLASTGSTVHVAWSDAKAGSCLSNRLLVRTSRNAGVSFRDARVASEQRTYGWPELTARKELLLIGLQKPDGSIVIVRSADGAQTFTERLLRPAEDRALGAADLLLTGTATAWLVYADVAYVGNDVKASKVVFRSSTNGGRTWTAGENVVGFATRLREATNIAAAQGGKPVIVFNSGRPDGSTATIVAVHPT